MNVSPRPLSRPDCRSGTRKGHVPGIGANTARRVRLFKRTSAIGNGEIHGEVHPDHRDGAAGSGAGHGVHDGGVGPDRLDHALGTASAGGLEDLRRAGRDAGVDWLRPVAFGAGQPLGNDIHGKDARRAEERCALQRHDPDGAEAHDDHVGARPNGRPQRTEVARREDVGEKDGLFVGDAFRDGEGEEVGERHRHGLGLAAGQIGHRPERCVLVGQAHVGLAGQAGRADAAPDHARNQDTVTALQASYVRADFCHRPDGLVTELNAGPRGRIVVQVQIRTADGGALDRHDDALGSRQDGVGHVLDRDAARSLEDGGSHLRTLPRRTTLSRA